MHDDGDLRGVQGDEGTDRFLRVLLELAVAHCLASEQPLPPLSPPPAGQPPAIDSALPHAVSNQLMIKR